VDAAIVTLQEFQSAPGGEAGGNIGVPQDVWVKTSFNPPPAVRPGETVGRNGSGRRGYRFNPPPAVRPGETPPIAPTEAPTQGFNPPPAVRPGETARVYARPLHAPVSIRPRR